MARYIVGEVAGTNYWHEVDEPGTERLRQEPGKESLFRTTSGLEMGGHPYPQIPPGTHLPVYTA